MNISSGHSEATYTYAHHMGSGTRVPALAWARVGQHRVELSGDAYPGLSPEALEQKAIAIAREQIRA
jgi:hypothetical protein